MGQAVLERPLHERYRILDRLVADAAPEGTRLGGSSIRGRVVPLLPQRPFFDGSRCCRISQSEEDVQTAFDEATKMQARPAGATCPGKPVSFCCSSSGNPRPGKRQLCPSFLAARQTRWLKGLPPESSLMGILTQPSYALRKNVKICAFGVVYPPGTDIG